MRVSHDDRYDQRRAQEQDDRVRAGPSVFRVYVDHDAADRDQLKEARYVPADYEAL